MRPSIVPIATFIAVVATFATANAQAQTKPFKIRGEGYAPEGLPLPGQDPLPHYSTGTATHLGRHQGVGSAEVVTLPTPGPPEMPGKFGSGLVKRCDLQDGYVFVGADGDRLACDYGRDGDDAAVGIWFPTSMTPLDEYRVLMEVAFVAEFVPRPDQSTGKFRGVEGSWTMVARTEPFVVDFFAGSAEPFAYTWEGQGELTFRQGGRKK